MIAYTFSSDGAPGFVEWENCDTSNEGQGMIKCDGYGGMMFGFTHSVTAERLIVTGNVKGINFSNARNINVVVSHDSNLMCDSIIGNTKKVELKNPTGTMSCPVSILNIFLENHLYL